jgi:methionine-rich copper-binding protein CopC
MALFGSARVLAILKAVVGVALVVVMMSQSSASAQADAPTVTDTSPDSAETGVAIDANITATFSKEMEESTLTSSTVQLQQRVKKRIRRHGKIRRVWRWVPITATQVSCDNPCQTVTLDPSVSLAANRTHRAIITTGAKDKDNNALAQNYSWSFTTGASQKLPDLGMARLTNMRIDETSQSGKRLLRFSALIRNVGDGPFEVRGKRDTTSSPWSITQRIYDSTDTSGHYTEDSTGATVFYAGDGHTHWHVKDLQSYELDRLDNGSKVGTGAKSGFCFYDTTRGSSATLSQYFTSSSTCASGQPNALQMLMGITVGWGDLYSYQLPDQYIDITNLTPGGYRLTATADLSNHFQEKDESNNVTWVDLQITGGGVNVQSYGPSVPT